MREGLGVWGATTLGSGCTRERVSRTPGLGHVHAEGEGDGHLDAPLVLLTLGRNQCLRSPWSCRGEEGSERRLRGPAAP